MSAPFWRSEPGPPAGRLPAREGIVIIGGGITGVSLLHHLGGEALLLERAPNLAAGASGRNAGFLLAGVASNYAEACALYGRTSARDIWALTSENHDRFLEALGGDAPLYARRGSWTLAASAAEASELLRSQAMLEEDGFSSAFVPRPPGLLAGFPGGLLNPGDGEIDPAAAVRRLAAPLASRILCGVDVQSVAAARDGVLLTTSAGDCRADVVVLATNGYARMLAPSLPVEPVRGQMLAARVDLTASDRPAYSNHGYNYWRQVGDVALMGGYRDRHRAAEVGFVEEPTDAVQALLERHLRELDLSISVTHRWAGVMGFSPDGLPLVGAVDGMPGVHFCGGYTGHGMGFAFSCAAAMARRLRGGAPPPAWMDIARLRRQS